MPKLPTYERSVGLGGGATASYASDGAFTAPARALAGMGNALANVGESFDAAAQKVKDTTDDAWFSKARAQTATDMITAERELQQSATGEAGGYIGQVGQRYEELRNQRLAEAPSPRAQQMYTQWADAYGVDLTSRSSRFQAESEIAKRTTDFAEAMNAHSQAIFADPGQYDSVYKRAQDDFNGARQWMTPEQEAKAWESVDRNLKLARAKSLALFKPDEFLKETGRPPAGQAAGTTDAASLLRKFEGFRTGTYWDVNAYRTGYGSDTITRADGSVVKVKQGDTVTKEDAERDLARRARDFEQGAARQVGPDKWSQLPGNARAALTSVAYNYGSLPGSVVTAVRSGDLEQIATAVEGLRGHNNGINSKRRMEEAAVIRGGGGAVGEAGPAAFANDPRYAGLSVDEIISLQNAAQQKVSAQASTEYAATKDSIELGIATGEITSESQILGSGLNGGDQATLLGKLRTATEESRGMAEAWTAFKNGTLTLDSYETKDRTLIDKMEQSLIRNEQQTAPPPASSAPTSIEGAVSQLSQLGGAAAPPAPSGALGRSIRSIWVDEVVRQTGIVPKATVSEINRGLESSVPQEVAAAAARASRISQVAPAALPKRDNGSKAADAAVLFDHYTNTVGLSDVDAAKRLIDARDPEKVKARKALMDSEQAKTFIKNNATESAARDIFDPGIFGFDPDLGETPAQSAKMVGEFKEILEESLYDANGDTEAAKALAQQRFARIYRPSDFTFKQGAVTRYPIELTYPADKAGSHEYIRQQAVMALGEQGIETDAVYFQSDKMTDTDVRAGRPPRYVLYYEKDGAIEQFQFPFSATPAVGGGMEDNRARWQENRSQLEAGRNREQSLDNFLDGNPLTGQQ